VSPITKGVHFFQLFISWQSWENSYKWQAGVCQPRNIAFLSHFGPEISTITIT
jgi:hypothetical protein